MANTEKFLDKNGVRALWEQIHNTFAHQADYELDKAGLEADIESLQNDVEALQNAGVDQSTLDRITALEESAAGEADRIGAAVQEVLDGAPEAYDTLKEVADYIASDEGRAADMIDRIVDLENAEIPALTPQEVKDICDRVYDELHLHKYVAEDKEGVLRALNEIQDSGSIVLEEDVDLGSQILAIPEGKVISIDLGGNEMTLATASNVPGIQVVGGSLSIENGTINATKRALQAYDGGSITLGEGAEVISGDVAVGATGAGSEIIVDGGSITAQESGVLVTSGARVEMNDGTITGLDNGPIMGNGTRGQGDVEIVMNGGELIANIESAGYVAVGVYMPNSGTFTMNGGRIVANGGAGVVCRGGLTKILGGEIVTTAHPTLEVGKVGDSRVVVPCSAVVYDKNSKYPAMDSLEVIIGADAILNGAHEDITIISDEAEPRVIDNRN